MTTAHREHTGASALTPLASLGKHQTTLSNGTRAIAVPMPGVHRSVIDVHLRVGSRFETPEDNGLSHFLEHMLYRGTPNHGSAHAQALAFEELGGTLMAATAVDHGTLTISVPPESIEATMALLSEVYHQPLFTGIDVERGVVREEILESLDEHGRQVDPDNLIRELVFGDHGLGRSITGTIEHVDAFSVERLRAHHAKFYVGANSVVCCAGPFDPERLLHSIEKHFSLAERGESPEDAEPAPQSQARFRFVRNTASQTALRVAFRGPGEHDPDEPSIEMLLRILDDGMSTRLYHRICDERGLCYDVGAGYEAYADTGMLEMSADAAHERGALVLEALLTTASELRDHGPTTKELDKARRRFGWQLEEMLDDPDSVADFYAFGELTQVAQTPAQRYAQLLSVTEADLRRVAERLFRPENLSVVAVGLLAKRMREKAEQLVHSWT